MKSLADTAALIAADVADFAQLLESDEAYSVGDPLPPVCVQLRSRVPKFMARLQRDQGGAHDYDYAEATTALCTSLRVMAALATAYPSVLPSQVKSTRRQFGDAFRVWRSAYRMRGHVEAESTGEPVHAGGSGGFGGGGGDVSGGGGGGDGGVGDSGVGGHEMKLKPRAVSSPDTTRRTASTTSSQPLTGPLKRVSKDDLVVKRRRRARQPQEGSLGTSTAGAGVGVESMAMSRKQAQNSLPVQLNRMSPSRRGSAPTTSASPRATDTVAGVVMAPDDGASRCHGADGHADDAVMEPDGAESTTTIADGRMTVDHERSAVPELHEKDAVMVPFCMDTNKAYQLFDAWRNQLWLAPPEFANRASLTGVRCERLLVPFYLLEIVVHCRHYGQVTEIGVGSGIGGKTRAKECSHTERYASLRVEAFTDESVPFAPEDLLEIDGWDFTTAVPYAPPPGVTVIQAAPLVPIWKEKTLDLAEDQMRKYFNKAIRVQHERSTCSFPDAKAMGAYASVFCISYEYIGMPYMCLVNGQTGRVHGDHPWGVSGMARQAFITAVTGGFFGERKVFLCRGAALNEKDNVSVYLPHHTYLVFPPSDQFLMRKFMGYIVVRNGSSEPITIQAQRRRAQLPHAMGESVEDLMGSTRGRRRFIAELSSMLVVTLLPGRTEGFDYRGSWTLVVLDGPAEALQVVNRASSGGGHFSTPHDKLGMTKDA